jgi:type IV secretion system protein VirB2
MKTLALNKNILAILATLFAALLISDPSFAQVTDAQGKIESLFKDLEGILKVIAIVAVTAGIMISGFQVTFGNKRPAETIPILVGAVFVGVAAQIASFLAKQ